MKIIRTAITIFFILLFPSVALSFDDVSNEGSDSNDYETIDLSSLPFSGDGKLVHDTDGNDFFKFTLTEDTKITITISSNDNLKFSIGNITDGSHDEITGDTTSFTFIASANTTYYPLVKGAAAPDSDKPYTLTITSLPPTPVTEYRFDECLWDGTADEIQDNSENDRHGTSFRNAQIAFGKINHAGYFTDDGSNYSYAKLNAAFTGVGVDSWTFTSWVKIKPNGTYQPILFVPDSDNTRYGIISLWYYSESNKEAISLWAEKGSVGGPSININLSDNKWHFISVTYDGTDIKLNIDDSYNNTTSYNHGSRTFSSTNDFYAGMGRNDGAFAPSMYIDEVKVFNTPLSPTDITTIYTNEYSGKNYDGSTRAAVSCSLAETDYFITTWRTASDGETIHIPMVGTGYKVDWDNDGTIDETADNALSHEFSTAGDHTIRIYHTTPQIKFDSNDDKDTIISINQWGTGLWTDMKRAFKGCSNLDGNFTDKPNLSNVTNVSFMFQGATNFNQDLSDWNVSKVTNFEHILDDSNLSTDNYDKLLMAWDNLELQNDLTMGARNLTYCLGENARAHIMDSVENGGYKWTITDAGKDCSNYIPIAEYRFDSCEWDGTPREVMDQIDLHDASITANDVNLTSGKLNNAASFPNENNITDIHAIKTDITPMDIGNQGSISFWFKSHSAWDSGEGRTLIDASKGNKYFFISLTTNGKIKFYLEDHEDNGLQIESRDNFSFSADTWVHLTITWDLKHQYALYIDGQNKTLNTIFDSLTTTFGGLDMLHIGDIILDSASTGRENAANGIFDEVKIFNTMLTDFQVQTIYERENSAKNYDDTIRETLDCSMPLPMVNYYLDNCIIGTEIGDQSTNDLNLTVINGVMGSDGVINYAADLNGSNYLDGGDILNDIFGSSSNEFTITAWINPRNLTTDATNHDIKNTFFAKSADGYNDNLEIGVDTDGSLYVYIDTKNVDGSTTNTGKGITIGSGITTGTWHFVSIRLHNNTIKVSIDENITANTTALYGGGYIDQATGSPITIGSSQHVDNYFDGQIDEVKVFNKMLTNAQIQEIYTNESQHKNYDGSHRMAIDCTTPTLLAEYRFDECKYTGVTGEVIDTEGGDNNGSITDNASISKNEKKVGHSLFLDGGAVDVANLTVSTDQYKKNTVMFWMYWDGQNGVMPFGWYQYDLWIANNSMGFNTAVSDKYGLNINSLKNGWHHITAIFTNGDVHSNQLYIDGILQTLSQLAGTPNNNNSYAGDIARIGGWGKSDDYRFKSYLDELKIYKGEVNATIIASIYNSENSLTRDIICSQAIFNAVNQTGGCFNWDNNITTKIAGEDIQLTILSADENDGNTSLQDTNITKLELLSFSDVACSALDATTSIWTGEQEINASACWTPPLFQHDRAIRCAKIRITGTHEGNTVESNSTDTFSIRPDKFVLVSIPTQKLISEHNYSFQAQARNLNDDPSPDYNTSITPANNKYFRDNSDGSAMDGTFVPTADFSSEDGATDGTTLSFNNVGKIGLELKDTNWTLADADDTPLADRTIYLEQNLTFIPAKFQVTFPTAPLMSNYHNKTFTYYANDLTNMGANLKNLSFKVTALGENDGVMTNYQNPQTTYFANNSVFSLGLDVEQNPLLSSDINESSTKDLGFALGVATVTNANLTFNFGRERNVTKNPIMIDGTNSSLVIDINDSVDASVVTGNTQQAFTGSSTFYYGKIKTHDIKTADSPTTENLNINVYWDGTGTSLLPATFKQQTASWYTNTNDDAITTLANTDFQAMAKRKLVTTEEAGTTLTVDTPNAVNGQVGFSIDKTDTSTSQNLFYHVDVPTWLWYSRYENYDFSANTTCGQHPCFEYIFKAVNSTIGIKSGNKTGSSFDNNFGATTKRKAIKILR